MFEVALYDYETWTTGKEDIHNVYTFMLLLFRDSDCFLLLLAAKGQLIRREQQQM